MGSEGFDSLATFAAAVEKIKWRERRNGNKADLIFRGQPCDCPLLPRLGRLTLKGGLPSIERLVFEEFKRTSPPLREFNANTDWDLLALAQHHGLPTRLLDWTYSALAAVWFAVRPFQTPSDSEGVVWVLAPTVGDFKPEAGDGDSGPFDNSSPTLVFRPKAISRRIVAQAGLFTVHKIIEDDRFVALDKNKNYKKKLSKFTVPQNRFERIRQELNMFGANDAFLFPDLDGLCNHLKWRYTLTP